MTTEFVSSASPMQREIWRQARQRAAFSCISLSGEYHAAFDSAKAQQILTTLCQEHDILRSSYQLDAHGILCMAQQGQTDITLVECDWQNKTVEEIRAEQSAQRQAWQSLDWQQPRAVLVCARLAEQKYWLSLALPSLNADTTTAAYVLRSVLGNAAPSADEEIIQYGDIADWLNDFLVNDQLSEAREKWDKNLVKRAYAEDFGLKEYRGEANGQTHAHAVDLTALRTPLLAMAGNAAASLADVICASLRLSLANYSERAILVRAIDVRSGSLCSAFGPLQQVVPLHPTSAPRPLMAMAAADLVAASRNEGQQLAEMRDYVECFARPTRYDSRGFPFVFSYLEMDGASLQAFQLDDLRNSTEDALMQCTLVNSPSQLSLQINYDSGFLSELAVKEFASQWQQALAAALTPNHVVTSQQGLVLHGPTVPNPLGHENVITWFDSVAARGVGQVIFNEDGQQRQSSLADIARRANALANYLIDNGVNKGDVVALHFASSIEFVIAILGVLKAGAAYLPIDVALPAARIETMLAECNPTCILRDASTKSDAEGELDIHEVLAQARNENSPQLAIAPDDLAYLLYTSGSTGTAKGICIKHDSLVNHMTWMIREFAFSADDVFMQRTSVSFDASIWEFWIPLLAGSSLLIVPHEVNHSPRLMTQMLLQYRVTTLQLVPSLLAVLLEQGGIATASALRHLFLGGEALPSKLAREAVQRIGCEVVNVYGPSECCIQIIFERFDEHLKTEFVPIGQLIDNVSAMVLRADGELATLGQEGELLLAGRCLFAGYHSQAQLTSNALYQHDGVTYYKSGDWVRVLPDQKLYFIERKDDQIKHNGYRIELNEIAQFVETRGLAAHAVCVYNKAKKQLCLFVITPDVEIEEMLIVLRQHLPEYMVPAAIFLLTEFPRLSSGKVDKKALASRADVFETAKYRAPSNPIEAKLADIWMELLHSNTPISVDVGFFALGGDSLLAMRLNSRISENFDVDVKMRSIFEHETIQALAAHISIQIAVENKENSALARNADSASNAANIPLSFAQQRLWFVDQLEDESGAYNVPKAYRVQGALDLDALRNSIGAIVHRHEILRTKLVLSGGEPVQQVVQDFALPFVQSDLRGLDAAEQATRVQTALDAELNYHFDLGADLMLRSHVLILGDEEYVLIFNMHHIVSDGWSQGIFLQELSSLYNALSQGELPSLPELQLQYADYAIWQRDLLQTEAIQNKLEYWRRQLDGLPDVHNLPLDYPRGAQQGFHGDSTAILLEPVLTEQITRFCQEQSVTLFMFLQAALAVLLARYSNETDIVIGSPISGRIDRKLEPLIGCFVNNLVIRNDLSENPAFLQFLAQAKQVCLDAQANQEIPFEMLVEELNPDRSLSYNPLFQVMLVSENAQADVLDLQGLQLERQFFAGNSTKFDLLLAANKSDAGLRLIWTYNMDLFAGSSVERMAANFEVLLRGIMAQPQTRFSELPLLSATERQQVLIDWNNTQADFPAQASLVSLFEAQVLATPQALAISDGTNSLSYAQLNARANQLARHLQAQIPVQKDGQLVGLCMERSLAMVVGMLAIVKTGAAYLPLDPDYPAARLAYLISDAQAVVVITETAHRAVLPTSVPLICLDDASSASQLANYADSNLACPIHSESAACAIYTSGSTGEPKGVLMPHRSIINRLHWMRQSYPVQDGEVFCQKTSLNFVDHVAEVFQPLTQGTPMVLIAAQAVRDVHQLIATLKKHRISRITLVPSLLSALVEHEEVHALPDLRYVISSGEALSGLLATRVKAALPHVRLLNIYGSTEVGADVTCAEFTGDAQQHGASSDAVSMGQPIANSQAYVLDSAGQLLPIGAKGELHIGGAGLALGYLHQAAMTAERFIAHPFSQQAGAKLYKTGDIVRWLANGQLAYLGRKDHQVKIRGIRIEIGEIEARLQALPEVKDALLVQCALASNAQEIRLVAYLVPTQALAEPGVARQAQSAEWTTRYRSLLKQHLPDYMLPDVFMFVPQFPLTKTGKVDRKALPLPAEADLQTAAYVAPRTEIEITLCHLWESVLKLERVGIADNFFELGGHSLLATRLMSLIRQNLGIEMPLRVLFEYPTIAGIAANLRQYEGTVLSPLVKADRALDLPLSFAQQRLWFIDQLEQGSAEYNLPLRFQLRGHLDRKAFKKALQAIVDRHEVLRTSIVADDGEARQVVREAAQVIVLEHDIRQLERGVQMLSVARLTKEDAGKAFDLSKDVLLRAQLFQLADDSFSVFFNLHHIAADGWSMGILFRELNELYSAFSQGKESPLLPLKMQYADYAQWQRNWLQGEVLAQQMAYWRNQLQALPAVHSLPLDKPRPAKQRFKGKSRGQAIGGQLLSDIRAYCQREQVTLFMFLQSAVSVLLSRYSHETDIVLGSPIAGRTHSDVEPLIGLFVNSLVLRSDLSGDPSFSALLERNKHMILHAYEHQAVPFEMLVEQLQPERSLSHSPLFQIQLTLHNNEQHQIALHALSLERNVSSHNSIKCDLELTASELGTHMHIDWTYNIDLFAPASIERMANNFEVLLHSILAHPQSRISTLPLLSERELNRVALAWNDTAAAYPDDACLHGMFEAQVLACPEGVAVRDGELVVSYRELNARANRLAHVLKEQGVAPHSLVGLCMHRSLSMVVGMLAIMKAGAAYLPLAPEYPAARLAYMLADAKVALVISEVTHLAVLPQQSVKILCLDDTRWQASIAAAIADNLGIKLEAKAVACAIYTSGSTGEPKGVLMPHRSIINRLHWMRRCFPVAAGEVFCQKTSLNFVDHVAEVFQPLTQGTPLVVIAKESVRDVGLLIETLHQHRITRITLVPSLLSVMIEHDEVRALSHLRYIISSGEPLTGVLAARVRQCLPQAQLVNLYGSTEVGADVTFFVSHFGMPDEVMQYFPEGAEMAYNLPSGKDAGKKIALNLSEQIVTPDVKLVNLITDFTNTAMPESALEFNQYMADLNDKVMPHVVNVAHRKFIGHMTSLLPNFMGEFSRLVTIMNQNMVKIETSKSLTLIERQSIAMVHRQFFELPEHVYDDHSQNPTSNFGLITSGGTTSNITAMLCARNNGMRALGFSNAEIAAKGAVNLLHKAGLGSGVIIGSRLAHYSIRKAAGLLGIGEENILLINQDEHQKLLMSHLIETIEMCRREGRFIIAMIGMGGATETGTIDPLFEMAKIATRYKIHFHVDAAWGGAMRFSQIYRSKLKGIESADTVTFCAHKQLYLPQGVSIILFKNPEQTGVSPVHAAYQAQQGSFDMGQHTLEGSRPAISLMLHAAFHLLSRQGYGWLVDQSMDQASYFASLVEASGAFELVCQPEINIVNYRYIPAALRGKKYSMFNDVENETISHAVETIQQQQFLRAKTFVSKTRVLAHATAATPITVFRVVFSNPIISFDDLRDVLQDQLEVASIYVEDEDAVGNLLEETRALKNHVRYDNADSVPMGMPIANMRIYLLDKHLQLVPMGAIGDVYVAGPGLALGYLHRPELSDLHFISHPLAGEGERLYRTGDMAKYLLNGTLQFCGRTDSQVKLRGARVELAEIEAALRRIEGVQEVVVRAMHVQRDENQLVAYVTLEPNYANDQHGPFGGDDLERSIHLRTELRRVLPDFMTPELFVFLESFPMTVSGKIDRNKLALPAKVESQLEKLVAPRNFIESELCEIWQQILKIEKIGVKSNFFSLGGHSLLAMTVINHIKKRLGVRLPLISMFEYPDIESIANIILAISGGVDKNGEVNSADDGEEEIDIVI